MTAGIKQKDRKLASVTDYVMCPGQDRSDFFFFPSPIFSISK